MKQILCCILLLGLWACAGDDKAGQQETQQASSTSSPVGNAPGKGEKGSFLPAVAPEDNPLVQVLTLDFWVFEFYVVDEAAARAFNRGRWFRFYIDGTFESGHWQEKTGYGTWKIQDEEGKKMLYLDNIVDAEDAQWEIQGVNSTQDTMTWAGINKTGNAGVITKVINLLTRPTKAQFGVQE